MVGRRPHKPTAKTRAEVASLASFGVSHDNIAKYMGFSDETLRKHYREQLDLGAIKANAKVGAFLYRQASGQALDDGTATNRECLTAAMFWLKTRARWRETDEKDDGNTDVAAAIRELANKLPS